MFDAFWLALQLVKCFNKTQERCIRTLVNLAFRQQLFQLFGLYRKQVGCAVLFDADELIVFVANELFEHIVALWFRQFFESAFDAAPTASALWRRVGLSQLKGQRIQPSYVAVDQAFGRRFCQSGFRRIIVARQKITHQNRKTTAAIYNVSPDVARFGQTLVSSVVFKTQIKRYGGSNQR